MTFLIAYDVSHPRRLRRVARVLERRAVRCQYSVFQFRGTTAELIALLNELEGLIRPTEDIVQAWPIADVATEKFVRGVVRPLFPECVVLTNEQPFFVAAPAARSTPAPAPRSTDTTEDL